MLDWGKQIRRYRLINGTTQASLAEELGVEQTTISRWERGRQLPDHAVRSRLVHLIRNSDISEDFRKIHFVRMCPHPMSLVREDMTFISASEDVRKALKVSKSNIEGMDYRKFASNDVEYKFSLARESGFFDGEVASVAFLSHSYDAEGGDLFFHSRWHPERMSDGSYVALVIGEFLSRREYELQRLEKSPIRIVTMAELLGEDEFQH